MCLACILASLSIELLCCRKGKDYTYLYGKHVGTGSLTPYIDDAFDPRITRYVFYLFMQLSAFNKCFNSIVLDGEMLVWDPVSEKNLPFGTLKTAALGMTFLEIKGIFSKIIKFLRQE